MKQCGFTWPLGLCSECWIIVINISNTMQWVVVMSWWNNKKQCTYSSVCNHIWILVNELIPDVSVCIYVCHHIWLTIRSGQTCHFFPHLPKLNRWKCVIGVIPPCFFSVTERIQPHSALSRQYISLQRHIFPQMRNASLDSVAKTGWQINAIISMNECKKNHGKRERAE